MSNCVDRVARIIVVITGILMLTSLSLGVFTRYVIKDPFIWTEEIARFCMLWLTFNGASIIMKKRELINFKFLLNNLSEKTRGILRIFITLFIIIFLLIFLYYGYEAMLVNTRVIASATGISLFWPSLGLYLGAVFMVIHSLDMLFEQITALLKK